MSQEKYIQLELLFLDEPAADAETARKKGRNVGTRQQPLLTNDVRQRAKRKRLKVSFPDGTVLCDVSATLTMIMAIEKIGIERVASLGMENCHVPLVSRTVDPRYAEWTKPMSGGWHLMAQGDTGQKYRQLKSIALQLSVDVVIKMDDFDSMMPKKGLRKVDTRKKKARLKVVLSNGMIVCGDNPLQTYRQTIVAVGLDKIEKTNLKVGGNPIITSTKRYNGQVPLPSGRWLTVPATTKDKYKVLRIISALTKTPLEVEILGE